MIINYDSAKDFFDDTFLERIINDQELMTYILCDKICAEKFCKIINEKAKEHCSKQANRNII